MEDIRIKDFCKILNSNEFKMPIIVIYEKPKDYPNHYIARVWDADKPTNAVMIRDSLEEIRSEMPCSFVKVNRFDKDDNCIIEVWV